MSHIRIDKKAKESDLINEMDIETYVNTKIESFKNELKRIDKLNSNVVNNIKIKQGLIDSLDNLRSKILLKYNHDMKKISEESFNHKYRIDVVDPFAISNSLVTELNKNSQ